MLGALEGSMARPWLSVCVLAMGCAPGCVCTYSELFPQSYEDQELLRLIYYGGIQHEIRKAVWPFLLGHYQFGMTEAERKEVGVGTGGDGDAQQPCASHCCVLGTSQPEVSLCQSPPCELTGCCVPFVLRR